ncbi:Gfo/Idh/MocA family oxidoreductase [Parasphingopyxis sp.]|uniref:Gfo/Idh/MocA family protein n=1 Tax=Parasphingopyxis sp. TaxID=1920299 RepID=UPI0026182C53|nr:Gfo/Idh/MocA family oxidoreductase [Parasphingopyxis sp.]
MSDVVIGLVGCGRWGKLVLRDLIACGARVHVACRNPAHRGIAEETGAASIVDHWQDLPEVDGYVVVTPTKTHSEIVLALMPFGKPIFVEKPMTADVAGARKIREADTGKVFVMDKWRYHSGVEAMRAEIAAGTIGTLLGLRFQRWSSGHSYADVSPFWILAPHDLSIADHILGTVPPLDSAEAIVAAQPDLGCTAVLKTEGGPTVTLDIGVCSAEHLRRVTAIGEQGILELRGGYDTSLFVRRNPVAAPGGDVETIAFADTMPLLTEIQGFVDHIKGGPPPLAGAEKGCIIVERLAEIDAMVG